MKELAIKLLAHYFEGSHKTWNHKERKTTKMGRNDLICSKKETYKYLYRDDFALQAKLAIIFIAKQIM
jgi:hypothetical protein